MTHQSKTASTPLSYSKAPSQDSSQASSQASHWGFHSAWFGASPWGPSAPFINCLREGRPAQIKRRNHPPLSSTPTHPSRAFPRDSNGFSQPESRRESLRAWP